MDGFEGFTGALLSPEDAGYDDARQIHNGMIQKHPALIARCRGAADIAMAIRYARANGSEISVKGGGHNVAGRAVTQGGVMIDLSLMKGIQVDADARTARAEAGLTWGEFNAATMVHGLATTGGTVSTTGIAGLTLGGGFGHLMALHGLTVDNLLSVELVTATGEIVLASDDDNPDLFWALRGGGGNFGVVATFTYRLHPQGQVYGGLVAHPLEAAREGFAFYREQVGRLSDEAGTFAALVHAPDGSGMPLFAIVFCHADPARGESEFAPLLTWGEPVMAQVGPMPYEDVNKLLDAGFPKGALNYWKSSFLTSFDDGLIDTLVDRFAVCPSPMTGIVIERHQGAATRVAVEETAVAHREPGFNALIASIWTDPATTDANVAWTKETYAAMSSSLGARRYVNYLDDDEGSDVVRAVYGPNYDRLVEVKRRWDPDNVFHMNQNIQPDPA